jgi:hypothetical protein
MNISAKSWKFACPFNKEDLEMATLCSNVNELSINSNKHKKQLALLLHFTVK